MVQSFPILKVVAVRIVGKGGDEVVREADLLPECKLPALVLTSLQTGSRVPVLVACACQARRIFACFQPANHFLELFPEVLACFAAHLAHQTGQTAGVLLIETGQIGRIGQALEAAFLGSQAPHPRH